MRSDEENEEQYKGFGRWVLGFEENSEMGDLKLVKLMKDKEDERLITMVFLGVLDRGFKERLGFVIDGIG